MADQKKKYFHDEYFKKIIKLVEDNRLEEAIAQFHKYIPIYPEDLTGYCYCAIAYMNLGYFEEAEQMLAKAIITNKTPEKAKEKFILVKTKLLCLQGKYNECLDSLIENIDIFKKNGWPYFGALIYLRKQLGILSFNDYKKAEFHYLYGQIISYSEEKAISHIEEHKASADSDEFVKFVEGFPIRDIYFKLREGLLLENNNNNKIYTDMISNQHVFKYEANGHVGSELVDFFAVVTIKDTNDIITMYPYENRERRECIDLTPKNQEPPKAKRMSQIDKFNQRYGKI